MKPAPQRHAPVVDPALRPVLRGDKCNRDAGQLLFIPPVARHDPCLWSNLTHQRVIAQWRNNQRVMPRHQPPHRRDIEMVVMVVAEQHHIDRWQIVKPHPRCADTSGPGELHRAAPLRPHRIGQDVQPSDLDQHGGVTDQCNAGAFDALGRHGGMHRHMLWPWRTLRRFAPLADVRKAFVGCARCDVEKAAVVMVAVRPVVIAVFGHGLSGLGSAHRYRHEPAGYKPRAARSRTRMSTARPISRATASGLCQPVCGVSTARGACRKG